LKVDGYCQSTNEVFEFDGCLFHACSVCSVNRNEDGSLQELNRLTGRKNEDIRRETREKVDKLKEAGYCVRSIKECEWKKMKKRS